MEATLQEVLDWSEEMERVRAALEDERGITFNVRRVDRAVSGMLGSDDHPRIPSVVPPHPLSDFEYERLDKGDRIGTGGDANVYRATVDRNGETYPIAIKEPRFEGTLHQQTLDRFQNEAETWENLDDHDNIVTVYSWSTAPVPWLALEYMDGGTLASKIGSIDVAEALWLSGRIAEGIRHGHRHGVAHLDIKPSNVLLRETGDDTWAYPKVSDWGLAKLLLEHSKSVEGLSPTYAAPEQFDADEFGRPDDITDIYQLGAVVYELVAVDPPFSGPATTGMQSVLHDKPEPPSAINPAVPSAVDEILLKALAKRKDERYQGLLPFVQDIDAVLEECVGDAPVDSSEISVTNRSVSSESTTSAGPGTPTSSSRDGEQVQSDKASSEEDGLVVPRRAVLGVLGLGAVGAGAIGFAQRNGDNQIEPTTTNPTADTQSQSSPSSTPEQGSSGGDRSEPTLSERWSADRIIDHIWTVGTNFFFNGAGGSARASTSELLWTGEKDIDGGDRHLGYDTFCHTSDTVVFGFHADIGAEEPLSQAGAHFYAYDRSSGDEQWTHSAPDDGTHRRPEGAAVAEGITALGCGDWARTDPIIYGMDTSLGEQVWETSYSDRQLNAVLSHAGTIYLCFDSELAVLDPNTGSEIETRDTIGGQDAIVQGNSLFAIDGNGIVGYRLDETETVWQGPTIENISTTVTADTSLVVVGTSDGTVHALNPASGEQSWQGDVTGEVSRIALSPYYVWVVNSQNGLFALDRDSGEVVHQSTHDTGGSGIAVIDDILLLGGDNTNAYWIEGQ
jgi:serine/threonine-protein kinase